MTEFILCIVCVSTWAEWMNCHRWETFESVLNYCICGTFNFEIKFCNISDSCTCNLFVTLVPGQP